MDTAPHWVQEGGKMSDRKAFEEWAADKTFLLKASAGDGYVNVKEMAWEVWQAALQSGGSAAGEVTHELTYTYDDEGYCTGKYMKGVVSDEIFKLPHGTKLYTAPQPVVPPHCRFVMRGMVEYAECNDPGNPYLAQAQALLSAGKETV
jgi:hypothetical protein